MRVGNFDFVDRGDGLDCLTPHRTEILLEELLLQGRRGHDQFDTLARVVHDQSLQDRDDGDRLFLQFVGFIDDKSLEQVQKVVAILDELLQELMLCHVDDLGMVLDLISGSGY